MPGDAQSIQLKRHTKPRPTEIVNTLNGETNAALVDPKMKSRLADLVSAALSLSPADAGKFIAQQTEKWAKVVKFAGIKSD